jgi:hypothetical protein
LVAGIPGANSDNIPSQLFEFYAKNVNGKAADHTAQSAKSAKAVQANDGNNQPSDLPITPNNDLVDPIIEDKDASGSND